MSRTVHPLHRLQALALSAGTLVVLVGCATVTPIGSLLDNSARYNGKSVRVEGEVHGAAGGLGFGAYEIRDATGSLAVVSDRGGAPRTGSRIRVTGKFESLFTIGANGVAVLRETSRSGP